MSKELALQLAVSIGPMLLSDDAIVIAAGKFETFLVGEAAAKTPRKTAVKETPAAAVVPTTAVTAAAAPAAAAPAPTAAVAAPAVSAPASAASAATGSGITLQKVADAIIDLANTHSREAAVEILTKYGAQKVPQIKPADFAAVLADVATKKAGGDISGAGAGLM